MAGVALTIGGATLHSIENRLVATTGETLALAAADIADKLDRVLFDHYSNIQFMAEGLAPMMRDRAGMAEYLHRAKKMHPHYLWVGVTNAEGRIVAATNPAGTGKNRSDREWFRAVRDRGGIHVWDARVGEDSDGVMAVAFTAPILGRHGEFLGAVTSRVSLPVMEDVFRETIHVLQMQRGPSARIEYQFLNRDGDILADSVLRQEGTGNLKQMALPSALLSASAQPGYVEETHLRRHVPVVTGYAKTYGYGRFTGLHWAVLVRMDRSDILAPIRTVLWKLGVAGIGVLLPLVGLLFWTAERLRKEWTQAREESRRAASAEARFRGVLESAPDAIVIASAAGGISLVNRRAEEMFGYDRSGLLDQPIEILVPESFREKHVAQREGYVAYPQRRPMGVGVDLFGRRRDGSEFPVEIALSAVDTEEGRFVIAAVRDITERKETEKALLESETLLRTIIETEPECVKLVDCRGTVLRMNQAGLAMLEADAPEQVFGRCIYEFVAPEYRRAFMECAEGVFRGESRTLEFEAVGLKGTRRWLEMHAVPLRDHGGETVVLLGVTRDVTEHRRAEGALRKKEEQLRQSQKIEAIGQLTGGIAHDFNNLLTVINGYSTMTLQSLKADDPLRPNLAQIKEAGERAASLTQQLLAFSRNQVLEPKVLDLNAVVTNIDRMLRRVIGEDVDLALALKPGLGRVKVDPGQIEQVIMNLAVNARDAMPKGGRLTIETADVELDQDYVRGHVGAGMGAHVMLAVSDTGAGMDAETQARIFEPFFTTKEKGKGTGLGLATVYGVVKQSGGSIWVYSEPGRGTTFKIYLPRVDGPAEGTKPGPDSLSTPRGSETILLVEDEAGVRELVRRILVAYGYTVLTASRGDEALQVCGCHEGSVHLLMTDVVMPGMSGRALADRLTALYPNVKVLYMSGYTDATIARNGELEDGAMFLQKPFTPGALARKVREVLDAPESQG
jgi:PAS domain S-box-containing protein